MRFRLGFVWYFAVAAAAPGLWAQQKKTEPDFEVRHVQGNVYMFASDNGNVTVDIGEHRDIDGVLLVDSGPASLAPRILTEIGKLTKKPIRYVINTSADVDKVGGNVAVGKPGQVRDVGGPAAGQVGIYAQDNALTRLSEKGGTIPEAGWPTQTYERGKDFTFNGEAIQIFAEPAAHTDGDSIVFLRGSNVIAAGEVFSTLGYPYIDLARGGSINGELKALNHIIELAVPEITQEGGTYIIPGHGRLCDEADVVEYRDIVTMLRDRVADFIKRGKSLAETKAAKVSADFDGRYSQPNWTGDMFIEAVYNSLKGK
jgi:cyclase